MKNLKVSSDSDKSIIILDEGLLQYSKYCSVHIVIIFRIYVVIVHKLVDCKKFRNLLLLLLVLGQV